MFATNLSHWDRKPTYFSKFWTNHGGLRWGWVSSNHVCKTMSAGLAVVWQVSFLNKFCWVWSSGVVINMLKFSWMKRTCDVSKVFSQIESLQVDIKSLKYRKKSFWLIIRSEIINSSSPWQHIEMVSKHTVSSSVYHVDLRFWRSADRFPGGTNKSPTGLLTLNFWGHENITFRLKNQEES